MTPTSGRDGAPLVRGYPPWPGPGAPGPPPSTPWARETLHRDPVRRRLEGFREPGGIPPRPDEAAWWPERPDHPAYQRRPRRNQDRGIAWPRRRSRPGAHPDSARRLSGYGRAVARVVEDLESTLGTPAVGVEFLARSRPRPGSSRTRTRPGSSDSLDHLTARLSRPVRLANDANCFALSERRTAPGWSAGRVRRDRGRERGGIAVDGRILAGPERSPEWATTRCPGRANEWPGLELLREDGCIETFLSGPGLAHHERATGELSTQGCLARGRARRGRSDARALRRPHGAFRRINILDPDVIVLGGGMSNLARLYESVPRIWTEYAFSDRVDTPLRAPIHGDSSGVRGAAWLWTESP